VCEWVIIRDREVRQFTIQQADYLGFVVGVVVVVVVVVDDVVFGVNDSPHPHLPFSFGFLKVNSELMSSSL